MPILHFKGKSVIQNHHHTVKFHELEAMKSKGLSKEPSLDDNLIVHGDNLVALKALLPTYAGKVKCIYIDPPYNTGNEHWIYNDNVNSPMIQKWLEKEVPRDDLARHDKWCCMMYPRLTLLREFLREDGVIFVSIDDNEVHSLRTVLDEIFGESNWVGTMIWKNVTDNNPTNISVEHEYVHCYAKDKEKIVPVWKSKISDVKELLVKIGKELNKKHKKSEELQAAYKKWFSENKQHLWPLDRYKYIDEGGVYTGSQSVHNPGREGYRYDVLHPKTGKPCKEPLMGYRFPEGTMKQMIKEGRVLFGEDEDKIVELKLYASEYEDKLPSVVTLDGRLGSYELKEIFPSEKKIFDNPKPSALIEQLISFTTESNDIVLDSFAGSGTTAHAVLRLNQTDKGNRKFILVECEDYADKLTAERVRRVSKGVKDSQDEKLKKGLGGTFSFYELGKPIDIDKMLEGDDLPSYANLAHYAFFTATGETFDPKKMKEFYIGSSSTYEVFMLYAPDAAKLREMALNLAFAEQIEKKFPGKAKLVFAPACFLEEFDLRDRNIRFAQLPFEIYRLAE